MSANYFEFFGLPVAFQIDTAALRRAYLLNNRRFHPDFHTLSDAAQQEAMLELSTRNNEAYNVLSDPDKRLQHILDLYGMWKEEGQQEALPQDFLMEMMDLNEQMMELEMDFDAARYAALQQQLHDIEHKLQVAIEPVWARPLSEEAESKGLEAAKIFFLKRRYLLRIQKKLLTFAPA